MSGKLILSVLVSVMAIGLTTSAFALDFNPPIEILNPEPGDGAGFPPFNSGVHIEGDLLVLGAQNHDTGVVNTGQAYLFKCTADSCTILATIPNPTPEEDEIFGYAVSLSGTTVVIGAPREKTVIDTGAVYVYDCSASIAAGDGSVDCGMPILIENPTPELNDSFGYAVDISGNIVVVSAPGDDPDLGSGSIASAGSAYVYTCTTSCVLEEQLNDPDAQSDPSSLGDSIAVSGNKIVVGAAGDKVFYFDCTSFPCSSGVELINPDPQTGDQFGWSVHIEGDKVVVGAWNVDATSRFNGIGAAYVYDCYLAGCTFDRELVNPNPTAINFGYGVDIDNERVIIGQRFGGGAFLYNIFTGELLNSFTPPPGTTSTFASDVGVSGSNVIVGALATDDTSGSTVIHGSGAAYFYTEITDNGGTSSDHNDVLDAINSLLAPILEILGLLQDTEIGLAEIKYEVEEIEEAVLSPEFGLEPIKNAIDDISTDSSEIISITVNLNGKLKAGDFKLLSDITPFKSVVGHVAMKVPCDENGETPIEILAGVAPGVSEVPKDYVADLSNPGKSCLYHLDLPAEITDVAMINTNSPDKEDKDDNIGKKDVNFGKDAEHTVTITIEVTK